LFTFVEVVSTMQHPSSLILKTGSISTTSFTFEISPQPTIKGQLQLKLEHPLSSLTKHEVVSVWKKVKELVSWVNSDTDNKIRYGVATDGGNSVHILPLGTRAQKWQPIRSAEKPFSEHYPGYLTTNSGPRATDAYLYSMQHHITQVSGWTTPSFIFQDPLDDNLFAKLVRGEVPQWRVWEDDYHIAFLTPFPNLPGLTVVIPRRHLSSDILSLEEEEFTLLVETAWTVSEMLKTALRVETVGMFMEGFEIDYAHVKLMPVPMAQDMTSMGTVGTFHEEYQGYLSTQLGPMKSIEELDIPTHLRKLLSDEQKMLRM
jgi:diadenosine tetraphosphate (Ap4A) HIT family hydrolase